MAVNHNYKCPGCHEYILDSPNDLCDNCFEQIRVIDFYAFWEQKQIEAQQEKDDDQT